jgi:hypothetical protein
MPAVSAPRASPADAARACRGCAHFESARAGFERAAPGMAALASGFAALHADDGLCRRHARYVAGDASCAQFAPAAGG